MSITFAQNAPVNFETGGYGADWTWTVFENGPNAPLGIITNPDQSGINTSATVASFTALQSGQPWAGCESAHGDDDLGPFVLDATNSIIKIMVWKSVISDVGIKLVAASGWAQAEIKVANTLINQWEELTFDFSAYPNPPGTEGMYDQIVIFPDFNLSGRTQDNVIYFDNITFNEQGTSPGEPTVAAPEPPVREPEDVVSVFSGAYTNVAGTDFNPNWGQTTVVTFPLIAGNETMKYANFNYQGTQFASALDLSGMETLHLDMWTADATGVNISLISTGPVETPYALQITPNQWVSYDIPLTAFAGVNLADVIQLKFDGGNGSQSIYLDNIYFYTEGGVIGDTPRNPVDFETGGYGADWTWTVFENGPNAPLGIIANPDQSGINTSATVAAFTALQSGQPWAGCESAHGDDDLGPFVLDATNSIIKIMVWKPVISDVGIKLVANSGWAQAEIKVANTLINQWEELTFDFSAYPNPPGTEGMYDQIVIFPDFNLSGRTQDNVIYFDNITFNEQGTSPGEPTVAAPEPPVREPEDVVSVFSGAYTNVAGTDFNPNWGQTTVVTFPLIAGNETMKYANFNYQGTQFASALDLSGMETLHLDMWTADATGVNISLISTGPVETPYALQITPNQWVSYDIPLTAFAGVNLADVIQLKFDGGNGSQSIYLDNIYFYTEGGVIGDTPRNPVDFETGGYGADWTWTVFENGPNAPLGIIANPDQSGINTSATVAAFTALQSGQPWAGCESAHGDDDLGPFVLDATNSIIKIMVWKPVISDVGIKLVANSGWAQAEIKVANTLINQWEELTFDFSAYPNPPGTEGMYDQIVIFPDFNLSGRTQDNVIYFDNITFNEQGTSPGEPTVAAPEPPVREPEDVVSVFSGAYTNVAGTDFNPNWGQTTVVTFPLIAGNETMKYANFNYQGTQFASALDLSGMETLHLDMWTADATGVNISLISTGPVETPYALQITPNQWVSYDIPLTAFAGVNLADVIQLKFDGGNGSQSIYLDNIYFYTEGGVIGDTPRNPVDFETGGYGADWTWTVFENGPNAPLGIIANPDQSGINTSATVAAFTALQSGQPWAGCESAHGDDDLGPFVLDATNSIIKIMVWKPVISDVGIKLVANSGWAQAEIKVANTLINQWEELTFDFSAYPNPPGTEGMYDQIVIFPDFDLSGRTQDNVIYFDNITFNEQGTSPGEPTVAAPEPPVREPEDVVSVFSGAYTNVAGTDFNPNWGQTTVVTFPLIAGNETMKYANFNYQGTQFASALDLSGMETLHLDMWTADATGVNISLISTGPVETPYALQITPNQWVSYDIPLTAFAGVNLADVIQLKFDGGNGSQSIYLDNIYFYTEGGVIGDTPRNPVDFETGGYGADWTWTVFENGPNAPLGIIANPDQSGINTSATVAAFTALQSGQPWAGCESAHGDDDLGPFVLDATNSIIKIMVWKPVISDVGIKLVANSGWAQAEIKVANTLINQWEELTFDFSAYPNPPGTEGMYDQIVIFPDFDLSGRTQDNTIYFDNITFNEQEPIVGGPNAPVDFETGGYGADWTWTVFENGPNAPLGIIANPDQSGINSSATVAEFTALQSGQPWAGVESAHGDDDLGPFVLDATNSLIKIMVWKPVISDVGIKLVAASGWAQPEIKVANTLINQWEELTFDFSGYPNPPGTEGMYDQIVIFPDFDLSGRTQDNTIYFDNITFNEQGTTPGEPTAAAPEPPVREPEDVVSVFSGAYTNVAGTDFNPNWGQSTVVTFPLIAGNETMKYANFNYQGTQFASALDLSGMETLHLDMWTADASSVNVFLISTGPVETPYALQITPNQWVSYDIPLTAFAGVDLTDVIQMKFDGGNGSQSIYLDNIYFYTEGGVIGDTPRNPVDFETGGYGADWTWTVFENGPNAPLGIIANPDQSGINTSATVAEFTALQSGQPWAGVESAHGDDDLGPFVLDATNSIIKIMVWKPVISDVGIKLVAASGWAQPEIKVANTLINQWEELTFDFSGYPNPPGTEGMYDQIVIFPDFDLSGRTQDNTIYFDNITFNQLVTNNDLTFPKRILIYPNPVKRGNQIILVADVKQFELFDISGRVLISTNTSIVDTDKLSKGIYVLRIHTRNGDIQTQKLIVK
ncbi:T9SS type A sorting domain-containing protein [Lentimicrobium saccharophilum]|uniref:T9SS type A sorting domain-containing protein n=1 Tax=Lentimicrobium saccharophilum TaxID=1678841 RepID=UPI000A80A088|nr:T9SS type A sorting domain-containing protein [Lentimicrobium saccharophilum]